LDAVIAGIGLEMVIAALYDLCRYAGGKGGAGGGIHIFMHTGRTGRADHIAVFPEEAVRVRSVVWCGG